MTSYLFSNVQKKKGGGGQNSSQTVAFIELPLICMPCDYVILPVIPKQSVEKSIEMHSHTHF